MACSCYICSQNAIVRLKYKSSLAMLRTESRCESCAKELVLSDNTTIIGEQWIDESRREDFVKQTLQRVSDVDTEPDSQQSSQNQQTWEVNGEEVTTDEYIKRLDEMLP